MLAAEERMEVETVTTRVPETVDSGEEHVDSGKSDSVDMVKSDSDFGMVRGAASCSSSAAAPSTASSTKLLKRQRHKARKRAERCQKEREQREAKAQKAPAVSQLRLVSYDGVPLPPKMVKAKAKATPRVYDNGVTWPDVVCDHCKITVNTWKRMFAEAIENADDDEWFWECTCKVCLMAQGLTEGEAEAKILNQRSTPNWARKSRQAFKDALDNVDQMHMALSRRGKRELCKSWMLDAFAPYAIFIARKLLAQQLRDKNSLEYDALLKQLTKETDPAKVNEIIKTIGDIEATLESERMIAFEKHDLETQKRFVAAADYCDEFINLGAGFILRAWYICGACHSTHDHTPCLHFAMAKAWPRKLEDPLAPKQAWTCAVYDCWKKYETKYGMIAELTVHDDTFWFRTPVKDWDTLDIQAAMIEQEMNPVTPEALYESLPSLKPKSFEDLFTQSNRHLREDVDPTMVYMITDKKKWLSMPEFPWNGIFAQFHVKRFHGKKQLE